MAQMAIVTAAVQFVNYYLNLDSDASKRLIVIRDRSNDKDQPCIDFKFHTDMNILPLVRRVANRLSNAGFNGKVKIDAYADHHGQQYTIDFGPKGKRRVALVQRWEDEGESIEVSLMEFLK